MFITIGIQCKYVGISNKFIRSGINLIENQRGLHTINGTMKRKIKEAPINYLEFLSFVPRGLSQK